MASTGRAWGGSTPARVEPTWREIGIGAGGGALLGRLLCGGARGLFMGGVLGAAAGAAYGWLAPSCPAGLLTRSGRSERGTGATRPGDAAGEETAATGESPDFGSWTRAELYEEAQRLDITGRSSMTKAQLLEAVRAHHE